MQEFTTMRFDKTWSREQVTVWLKGLGTRYHFAEKCDGLTGEELYEFTEAQIKEIVGDVNEESKKFFIAFCNKIHPPASNQNQNNNDNNNTQTAPTPAGILFLFILWLAHRI
jgi:hypothetical protein